MGFDHVALCVGAGGPTVLTSRTGCAAACVPHPIS
jgi:hypothetical protein